MEIKKLNEKISMTQLNKYLDQGINEFQIAKNIVWKINSIVIRKNKEIYLDVEECWLDEGDNSKYKTNILYSEWSYYFNLDEEFSKSNNLD